MAHASEISSELDEVLEGLRAFLRVEVFTRHEKHAEILNNPQRTHQDDGRYAPEVVSLIRDVRMASAAAGYYSMLASEAVGGAGLGVEALYRTWETIFHESGAIRWLSWHVVAHWTKGPNSILAELPAEVRERVAPALLAGEATMCLAMSEPDAGSDAWMMRTTAAPDGDGWRINGEKQWITNAAEAQYAVVFAVTDPELAAARKGGISAFFVPTDTPGFGVHSVIRMFGQAGSNEGIIQLTDVHVPANHLIGEEGTGLSLALGSVSLGRVYNAAKSVGLARWAIERALDYVQDREAFGARIATFQGITFPLVESAMEVHAAHLMGLNCARLLDAGRPARKELAMAKAYSTEVGARAVDRAVQAHGAMGFTNELGLAVAWQQLRQVCVADGSSEILRRQVLSHLLRGDRSL